MAPEARDGRPALLLYCQHSLGIGHLTRSFALARALAPAWRVVFLNGGPLPPGLPVPSDMTLVDLPPLGMDAGHSLVGRGGVRDVAAAMAQRRAMLLAAVAEHRPALVVVELFPFGRKKFTGEILALIRAARRQPGGPARIACSLRDILVDARDDQAQHDERARWLADRYFDLVLVHADPRVTKLEETFRPKRPLRVPVYYTGYVVPPRAPQAVPHRQAHLLVSAGGGIVGGPLFEAVLRARPLLADPRLPMRVVAGPFLPEDDWQRLRHAAEGQEGVDLVRQVPDLAAEMRAARASLSQCGYNTALDIVVSGVPALVVPYATAAENEQDVRASRLAAIGALQRLDPATLTPATLARAIDALADFTPRDAALRLDGAADSARRLTALLRHVEPREPQGEPR